MTKAIAEPPYHPVKYGAQIHLESWKLKQHEQCQKRSQRHHTMHPVKYGAKIHLESWKLKQHEHWQKLSQRRHTTQLKMSVKFSYNHESSNNMNTAKGDRSATIPPT
jgi:hypothetical protein